MEFLVALGDLARRGYVDEGIFDARAGGVGAGFVDSDGDGEVVVLGFLDEALDEGGGGDGLGEGFAFCRAAADVIAGFGEEEGLSGVVPLR